MSYLSIEFGLLFLVFLLLYWLCAFSTKIQNMLLLVASYAFVGSFSSYALLVLLGYTVIVFILGYALDYFNKPIISMDLSDDSMDSEPEESDAVVVTTSKKSKKKNKNKINKEAEPLPDLFLPLITKNPFSAWSNQIILFYVISVFIIFKYYPFLKNIMESGFSLLNINLSLPIWDIVLPVGLSFYVFHSVSYLVAVKNAEMSPLRLRDLALYLAFFPSVIAGPINRIQSMQKQLFASGTRAIRNYKYALLLIAFAILKLWVLSSYLGDDYVDPVFASPLTFNAEENLLAVYAYALQIYFNFSGYSDLVIGLGLLLGFNLPKNFNTPYIANNLKEFWNRWHISLSTFIRDYIYIALGGNKQGFIRTQVYLLVAMLLSGLWHGAAVTFIIWGAIHGVGVVFLNIKSRLYKTNKPVKRPTLLGEYIELQTIHQNGNGNFQDSDLNQKHGDSTLPNINQVNGNVQSSSSNNQNGDSSLSNINQQNNVDSLLSYLNKENEKSWQSHLHQANERFQYSEIEQEDSLLKTSIKNILSRFITFHFVCFAWIFFRATSMDNVFEIMRQIKGVSLFQSPVFLYSILFVIIYPLFVKQIRKITYRIQKLSWKLYILFLVIFINLVIIIAPSGVPNFIYASF